MKKIYEITFNKYTNASKNTVYNKDKDSYLDIPKPFLIKEEDIQFIKEYGDGIILMEFVGYLYENA